jgi:hypothetical protein
MKPGMAAEAGARMMAGKALETSPFLPAPRSIITMIMRRVGASPFRRKGSNSTQVMPSLVAIGLVEVKLHAAKMCIVISLLGLALPGETVLSSSN